METKQQEQKFEFKNICPHCGAENTIFPKFVGRKRIYVCDNLAYGGCGKATRGITKREYAKRTGKIPPPDLKKIVELLGKLKQLNPNSSLFKGSCLE